MNLVDRRGGMRAAPDGKTLALVLLFILLAGLVALGVWYKISPHVKAAYVPPPVPPAEFGSAHETGSLPTNVRFVDVTESSGIHFRHSNGAKGKKLLPETMGGSCAFIDFDGDGDQDLLFVNSAPWPGDEVKPLPTQALYENDGHGNFRDVTARVGLDVTFYGMGAAIGDYDGDGWDDIFFTGVGGDHLFRNVEGKRFEETTRPAGMPREGPHTWSTGAAFLDYQNDGKLDLFVCRYVEWSPELDLVQAFQITGLGRAYGPPQNFAGAFCRLYQNTGAKFEDVSAQAGIEVKNRLTGKPMAKALGVTVNDLDGDGFPDIWVANDTVQNFLFHNRKDGTFEEIGVGSGFAFDQAGNTRGAMGIDCCSLDTKGAKAIVVGNFANEITALYKSPDAALVPFTDDAIVEGIGNPSRKYMKFGVFFFDFDLDGRSDIFEANGHLENEIQTVQAEQTYAQPAQLFWNAGPGAPRSFEALGPMEVGPDLFQPVVGRGCAYGDIDGDGDLDVVLVPNNGPAKLFRNDGGDKNHWIRLKLVGAHANRNAFGSSIEAEIGGRKFSQHLSSGRSYLSQCEQVITFGLGQAAKADQVRIFWPGKIMPQDLGEVPASSYRVVKEP